MAYADRFAFSAWRCPRHGDARRRRTAAGAQRRSPTSTSGISRDIYPSDEAWRAAKDKLVAEMPKIAAFKGTLGGSPQSWPTRWSSASRLSKEFARAVRLREHDVGPGHARQHVPGHAAGDDAARPRRSAPRPRSSSRRS